MKRGTVVWVDLSDASPPEMGKVRPGIVVSGTAHNDVLNTVVVVPTSGIAPEIWPLRVAVGSFAGKESYAGNPAGAKGPFARSAGRTVARAPHDARRMSRCLSAVKRCAQDD